MHKQSMSVCVLFANVVSRTISLSMDKVRIVQSVTHNLAVNHLKVLFEILQCKVLLIGFCLSLNKVKWEKIILQTMLNKLWSNQTILQFRNLYKKIQIKSKKTLISSFASSHLIVKITISNWTNSLNLWNMLTVRRQ